jgi:hypothetical protein
MFFFGWHIRTSYELLKNGIPVIGDILNIETRLGNRSFYYLWEVVYKLGGKKMTVEFEGGKEAPDQVLVLVDPKKYLKAKIYDNKFYWKLADNNSL